MLNNIGVILLNLDRYDEALQSFQDSLKIQRELKEVDVAATLMNIGIIHDKRGRYDEALRCYEESLKLSRDLGDRETEGYTLMSIGIVYFSQGRSDDALRNYEASLKIKRELGDRVGEAITLGNLGIHHKAAGRFDDALRCYQESLTIQRALGNRAGEANQLISLGGVYLAKGFYDEALRSYQDGLKLARELRARALQATALNGIGEVYRFTSRFDEALEQYQASLKLKREIGDRVGESQVLNNIGNVFQSRGQFPEALRLFQENLQFERERGLRADEVTTLGNIGSVYKSMGRFGEALSHYQDSLKIARALKARGKQATVLTSIGDMYSSTGRYVEAEQHYVESLKIIRELGYRSREVAARRGLGDVYRSTGRDADALQEYQASLQLARELKQRLLEGSVLNNIAVVYESKGQHDQAIEAYQDSLKIARALGNRASEALTLGNLGVVYVSNERYADALATYEAGRKLAEDIGDPTTVLNCSWGIGNVHFNQKQWPEAAAAYQQAIARIEQVRSGARERTLQTSFLARFSWAYYGLTRCLLEQGRSTEAFAVSEQAKARALVDVLHADKVNVRKSMSTEQIQEERRLQDHLTASSVNLENLHSHKTDPKQQQDLGRQLARARLEYDDFRRTLYLRHPDVQNRRAEFTPAALVDLDRALFARHPDLVVLSYLVAEQDTLLFVLTRGDKADGPATLAVHRIDVRGKELAEEVQEFTAGCAKPGIVPSPERLYPWLLEPAAEALASAKHVVIVPDGILHTLPFHALRAEGGKYLIERCAVSYAPSVTALVKMTELADRRRQARGDTPASMLALGISDFQRREPQLKASEPEARAVAALFGDHAKTLLGSEATSANLQKNWASYRYLHFSTHGRLNEAAPFYSSLVLTKAGDGDEGQLFARELLDADLSAELAVLSACQTGLGQRLGGEGILGMNWAWFAAGVPSTVVTQWSVADDSTAELMKTFYKELAGGAAKAEALRQAQLVLLKDRKTRHPFNWAPFILIGDFDR